MITNPELLTVLQEAGFTAAVDIALIDAEMADELFPSRPQLQEELLEIAARARPAADGWARSVSVFGGSGLGGLAGGTVKLENKSASSASDPALGAGGPGNGEKRASGSLRAVTRRVLKESVKSSPPAPPCFSRLGIEKHKIKLAATRIHWVLLSTTPGAAGWLR